MREHLKGEPAVTRRADADAEGSLEVGSALRDEDDGKSRRRRRRTVLHENLTPLPYCSG